MIICIGLAADETFVYGAAALASAGVSIETIDLGQLAHSGSISIRLDAPLKTIIHLHGKRHVLSSFSGGWLRMLDISKAAPSERLKRRSESQYQALCRLFEVVPFPVVNHPMRNASNFAKVAHAAALVPIVGFLSPRSCLTSKAEDARAFIDSCPQGVIFKGASGQKTWATSYDHSEHAERLAFLPHCPTLFQERIDGPDVRIHAVVDAIFAEAIESTALDYRAVKGNVYRPIIAPSEVRRGCLALVEHLDVPFLGIDFKIERATGEWFFLEANSAPCYQGYDRRAGGAISEAIASFLVGKTNNCG